MSYSIELDCPPGSPRPGDLLPSVLEDTGITLDPEDTINRFFGNWTWIIPKEQEERYKEVQPIIAERVRALHERGLIRYGSW